MTGRLQDKVAIITGGGSGFGRGIVKKFVAEGAKVLIWDIHETTAGEVSKTLPVGSSVPFVGDVSKFDDWQEAVKTAVETFGALDVVVNNTGVSKFDKREANSIMTTSGCP